jgi:hypothetical protein
MLLGDLIGQFSDEAVAAEAILRLGDLGLLNAVQERAAVNGVELGTFAAAALRRYAAEASDEEWITLMGALSRSPDPGAMCLKRALAHALQPQVLQDLA